MESPQGNVFVFFNLAETGVKHSKKTKRQVSGHYGYVACSSEHRPLV